MQLLISISTVGLLPK